MSSKHPQTTHWVDVTGKGHTRPLANGKTVISGFTPQLANHLKEKLFAEQVQASQGVSDLPAVESTTSDTLTVGNPKADTLSGTALGESVWVPKVSYEYFDLATKDPKFALRYSDRLWRVIDHYREMKERAGEAIETLRALRSHNAIMGVHSLRSLLHEAKAERAKREQEVVKSACKVIGIDPALLALLKNLTPEQIKAIQGVA